MYERHLIFDNVVDPAVAGARERFEALARSVRDMLSQRWIRTDNTYASWSSSMPTRRRGRARPY
jgi:starch phosphorylase